jgi:hypothetical protein
MGTDFSLLQNVQTGYGAHPASYWTGTDTSDLIPEGKATEAWKQEWTSISVQINNQWSWTSTPPHVHRDNSAFPYAPSPRLQQVTFPTALCYTLHKIQAEN